MLPEVPVGREIEGGGGITEGAGEEPKCKGEERGRGWAGDDKARRDKKRGVSRFYFQKTVFLKREHYG